MKVCLVTGMQRSELRAFMRVLWLMTCITAHILRAQLPMHPITRIWHRSRGLVRWRELRALYRQHGVELPPTPGN
jgi:hypothetical protein